MDKKNPPYGSVTRLKYAFDLFSTHNFPQVTSSLLKSRGFSGSDAFQTISSLKFLKIIDDDGNKTDQMQKLQLRGEERTKGIAEIIKNAYVDLFNTIEQPNKLSKDDLHNDFISVYGLSGRLAQTAVPNFLWLCGEAGLEVNEQIELKTRAPRSRSLDSSNKKASAPEKSNSFKRNNSIEDHSGAVEVGEFKLILPSSWDIEETKRAVVKGKFAIIYQELEKLSKELKKQSDIIEAG
jgi:hypothetical protein